MIAQEFIDELSEVRPSFDWQLSSDSRPRRERRAQPRFKIRALAKSRPDVVFEPIGAICFQKTGKVYAEDAWVEAADAIGLSLIDAADLVAAGNDRFWTTVRGVRRPDNYLQSLREKMREAVGLKLPES